MPRIADLEQRFDGPAIKALGEIGGKNHVVVLIDPHGVGHLLEGGDGGVEIGFDDALRFYDHFLQVSIHIAAAFSHLGQVAPHRKGPSRPGWIQQGVAGLMGQHEGCTDDQGLKHRKANPRRRASCTDDDGLLL